MDSQRWERIGISPVHLRSHWTIEAIQDVMEWYGRYVDKLGPSTPESPALPSDYGRRMDLYSCHDMLLTSHLEVPRPFDAPQDTLRTMSELAVDYFCGDWRENATCDDGVFTRRECRERLNWFEEYRMGLMAASLARREDDLTHISSYAAFDLRYDDGAWKRTREDNQYYIVLGILLHTGTVENHQEEVEALRASRRQRPRTLLKCLEAIIANDPKTFCVILSKHINEFKRREQQLNGRMVVSWDATILWNIAQMRGCELADLSEDLMDLVVTRQSLGLTEL